MKYCTNCQANKESWAEKLKDYNKYSDNQCWECDKYTLEKHLLKLETVGVDKKIGCNMKGGSWCETIYHNADGTSTRTYIRSGNWEVETHTVAPPKRPPSPDCKIL